MMNSYYENLKDFIINNIDSNSLYMNDLFMVTHLRNKSYKNELTEKKKLARDKLTKKERNKGSQWISDLMSPHRNQKLLVQDLEAICQITGKSPDTILKGHNYRDEHINYFDSEEILKVILEINNEKGLSETIEDLYIPILSHPASGTTMWLMGVYEQKSGKLDDIIETQKSKNNCKLKYTISSLNRKYRKESQSIEEIFEPEKQQISQTQYVTTFIYDSYSLAYMAYKRMCLSETNYDSNEPFIPCAIFKILFYLKDKYKTKDDFEFYKMMEKHNIFSVCQIDAMRNFKKEVKRLKTLLKKAKEYTQSLDSML